MPLTSKQRLLRAIRHEEVGRVPVSPWVGDISLLQRAVGERGILMARATIGVDQFLVDCLGVQQSLMLYYDDHPLLAEILRVFQGYHQAILRRVLELGIEVIFEAWYNCSMSVGWSPKQFRELFLPLIRENVELAHSYGAFVEYYDDGKMDKVLEDLADAGAARMAAPSPMPTASCASRSMGCCPTPATRSIP